MLLLDVLNEATEKAKQIMVEKNPEIDPKSAEADQLARVCPTPTHTDRFLITPLAGRRHWCCGFQRPQEQP